MSRIVIKEQDLTTAGLAATSPEVVYIPGLSIKTVKYILNLHDVAPVQAVGNNGDVATNIIDKKTYIKQNGAWQLSEEYIEPNDLEPILCTDVRTFERIFGERPYQFEENISYSDLFDAAARPSSPMFEAGSYDKSYLIAKELLNQGLPVLYHNVVNRIADGTITLTNDDVQENTIIQQNGENFIFGTQVDNRCVTNYISAKCSIIMSGVEVVSSASITLPTTHAVSTVLSLSDTSALSVSIERPTSSDDYIVKLKKPSDKTFPTGATVVFTFESNTETIAAVDFDLDEFYAKFKENLNTLKDKNSFSVKYITSGGFPTFEYDGNAIANAMSSVAFSRGDAVALIDHTDNYTRALTGTTSVIAKVTSQLKSLTGAEYSAMFTPWARYGLTSSNKAADGAIIKDLNTALLPASFGYLAALAVSIRTNVDWLAIAGATRGRVPGIVNLNTYERFTNTIAEEEYQKRNNISINPITEINPYGLTLWGNRTLKDNSVEGNLTATSFLNIRNMVSDIKKVVYVAAKSCIFEQNTDILWINFKSKITPILEQMKTGQGIASYKIFPTKPDGTSAKDTGEKAKLYATISIVPYYALEDIEVTIVLTDDDGVNVQ